MDGIEFIEKLPAEIPWVIISGFLYDSEYTESLEKSNPVAVLKKPFQISLLRETMASCLNPASGAI